MPRSLLSVPLAYSDFWELAGGGGEPAGGRKRRKREERENVEGRWGSGRTNGGLAEGWKRRCDRGEWASPETELERWTSLRPMWTSPRNARTRRGGMQAARPGLQPY